MIITWRRGKIQGPQVKKNQGKQTGQPSSFHGLVHLLLLSFNNYFFWKSRSQGQGALPTFGRLAMWCGEKWWDQETCWDAVPATPTFSSFDGQTRVKTRVQLRGAQAALMSHPKNLQTNSRWEMTGFYKGDGRGRGSSLESPPLRIVFPLRKIKCLTR